MSEMVWKVAKALYANDFGGSDFGEGCPPKVKDAYFKRARAALEAMREPTDAMVASVCGTGLCPSGVADIYIDMIDAALSEVEG